PPDWREFLNGLIGRKSGMIEGYNYSRANKNSGIVWEAATCQTWRSLQRTRHFCLTGSTMLQLLFIDGIRMRIRQDRCEGDV
ncbi:MAG TPA: hypothetical protein VFK30_16330, partial [Anaerolineae bacterium]|nr:hypothetical protein [Anaerolineae bacterium]